MRAVCSVIVRFSCSPFSPLPADLPENPWHRQNFLRRSELHPASHREICASPTSQIHCYRYTHHLLPPARKDVSKGTSGGLGLSFVRRHPLALQRLWVNIRNLDFYCKVQWLGKSHPKSHWGLAFCTAYMQEANRISGCSTWVEIAEQLTCKIVCV